MIVESLLTSFLKRKFNSTLQLTSFGELRPPPPVEGKDYLIYIHIPFCHELCPYCSFNRVPFEPHLTSAYFDALGREIEMYADLGYRFASAYVGGGTPTVLPDRLSLLLDDLRRLFPLREISLETNPNHLTADITEMLRDSGVNRLSVGVQSFDDSLLKQMERFHKYGSGDEIRRSLQQYTGTFDTLNVDMIFNFPTQTSAMLDQDLEIIQEIQADQVTFYPLMVSDMTRKELARRFGPISYQQEKLFYNRIRDRLDADYSVGTAWCFSRKRSMIDEYIVDYDEYVGTGSGSFGYAGGATFANTFSIDQYIRTVHQGRFPIQGKKDFSPSEQAQYDFMMKLFGNSLDLEQAERKYNGKFSRTLWKEISAFRLLGALVNENGMLRLTRKGQYLWVIMMREFFTGVNNFRDICREAIGETNHGQEPVSMRPSESGLRTN